MLLYPGIKSEITGEEYGNKAFQIAEMMNQGFPVPAAIAIDIHGVERLDVKRLASYYLGDALTELENRLNKHLGKTPVLLVSVRSGAPVSMPGMMDTILNIGLNDEVVKILAKDNVTFAYDSYRRLLHQFGTTVYNIQSNEFEQAYEAAKLFYIGLDEPAWKQLIIAYKQIYKNHSVEFPQDPHDQILAAMGAVKESWNSPRAVAYRKTLSPEDKEKATGTGILIQEMAFGNKDANSGTGVIFSRNPNTGEKKPFGDFLPGGQGEDVVAGTHNTLPVESMAEDPQWSQLYTELMSYVAQLEKRLNDIVDVEFTIESGKLYILQARRGKATKKARITTVLDLFQSEEIDIEAAVERLAEGSKSESVAATIVTTDFSSHRFRDSKYRGYGAVPGVATGYVAITHEQARQYASEGKPFIYVATETSPDDMPVIIQTDDAGTVLAKAAGILTSRGGAASHAALIAREWDIVSVLGMREIRVYEDYAVAGDHRLSIIKINGTNGLLSYP